MTDTLVTPEILQWVGNEAPPITRGPVTAETVARYAIAIGDHNPAYFDVEAARSQGHPAIPAPIGYIYWAAYPGSEPVPPEQLREDGTPSAADPLWPPLPLERRVRGGDEYEFFRRLYVGDYVTLQRRLVSIDEKTGSSGVMVVLVEEWTYTNGDGELLARQKITRIRR